MSRKNEGKVESCSRIKDENRRLRGKTGKQRKGEGKKKWWVLAQPPYSLQEREAITQVGTIEQGG